MSWWSQWRGKGMEASEWWSALTAQSQAFVNWSRSQGSRVCLCHREREEQLCSHLGSHPPSTRLSSLEDVTIHRAERGHRTQPGTRSSERTLAWNQSACPLLATTDWWHYQLKRRLWGKHTCLASECRQSNSLAVYWIQLLRWQSRHSDPFSVPGAKTGAEARRMTRAKDFCWKWTSLDREYPETKPSNGNKLCLFLCIPVLFFVSTSLLPRQPEFSFSDTNPAPSDWDLNVWYGSMCFPRIFPESLWLKRMKYWITELKKKKSMGTLRMGVGRQGRETIWRALCPYKA